MTICRPELKEEATEISRIHKLLLALEGSPVLPTLWYILGGLVGSRERTSVDSSAREGTATKLFDIWAGGATFERMQGWRGWRHWRWARDATLAVLLLLGIRAYQQRDIPTGTAPSLAGVDLHGDAVSLADYRGKPVLVHFWATWCGVCKAEQHNIDAVTRDLPTLTIASHSQSASEVAAFIAEHGLAQRVIVDEGGELANRFGVHAYPTTFILDGLGKIRHVEVGYTTELGLRVRMWLAGL